MAKDQPLDQVRRDFPELSDVYEGLRAYFEPPGSENILKRVKAGELLAKSVFHLQGREAELLKVTSDLKAAVENARAEHQAQLDAMVAEREAVKRAAEEERSAVIEATRKATAARAYAEQAAKEAEAKRDEMLAALGAVAAKFK